MVFVLLLSDVVVMLRQYYHCPKLHFLRGLGEVGLGEQRHV